MTFIPGHVGDPAFEPGPTEALRHAVELSMQVEFRQFGVDLFRGER